MRMYVKTGLLALLISVFFLMPVMGQRYLSLDRTVQVYKVLDVSLTTQTSTIDFSALANYDNGITNAGMFMVTVKSNVSWKLTVSVNNNILSPQATLTPMPSSIMNIKQSTSGTYTPLQNTAPFAILNTRGLYTHTLDLRALPGYAYNPGEYVGDIYFTLTEQ